MTRKALPVAAVGLTLAIGLTGCGDDGSAVASGASGSSTSGSGPASGSRSEHTVPAGVAAGYATMEEEIAAEGGELRSGAWRVAYIVEPAEPWWEQDGRSFREPAVGETHHIEVLPFEAKTGRLVPAVPITVEVVDADGTVVDEGPLAMYHAEFFHYAGNFSVPEPGEYTLRAILGAPELRHHGERAGEPTLAEGVTVTFEGVRLEQEG